MNNTLFYDDTIAAIATAMSPAGIGIIRISGKDAINIASKILVDKEKNNINICESHKVKYAFVYDKNKNEFLDEVLVVTMLKPKSYTAEDVVEIQCHGGILILKNILKLIISNGARLAEPGEFTKRAFLNGRIDLSKAESITDIIMSKNDMALKASFQKLKGNLSNKLNIFRNNILEATAFIEACLDDPEHMDINEFKSKYQNTLITINNELKHIIDNYENGKLIREGINTVILGEPNVGKSSLLNLLLNEERAIVTDIAGTTRDTIKESINLNGLTLNIIDTAGIRDSKILDKVEKIGIEKAKEEANNGDLIILMFDATKNNFDYSLLKINPNIKKIILFNKCDLLNPNEINLLPKIKDSFVCINISTKTLLGIEELKNTITKLFINKNINYNDEIFISNERELSELNKAKDSLSLVLNAIEKNVSEDFLTIDLTNTYSHLSKVLGIEIGEDLINEIFSKFCMGK